MNTRRHFWVLPPTAALCAAGLLLCDGSLRAQLPLASTWTFPVGEAIPDNDDNGLLRVGAIAGSGISQIGDVNVWLEIIGGYNGDLYVTLAHGSGYAVLLNRVGRRDGDRDGYTDPGFDGSFRLDDQGVNGDVHQYRLAWMGDHGVPLNGPLGGEWQPDGRAVSPHGVTAADAPTAMLSSFADLGADGEWTLFAADLEAMGEGTLVSWGLEITSVPEPVELGSAAGLSLLGWSLWRRDRRNRPAR